MSDVLDAYNSIKEDGGAITITFDNDDIVDAVEEDFDLNADIAISTYAVRTGFKQEVIDGTLVKLGDCKFIVPAYGLDSIDIKTNYKRCSVSFAGEDWKVIDVKPISPAGTDIIYYLHSRK